MSVSKAPLNAIRASFATVSIGTPDDPLENKLKAISSAGFTAVELCFPDLLTFAHSHSKSKIKEDDYEALCSAATEVKQLCQKYDLAILMLQPFPNFEGWAPGSPEREDAFARARGWIRIMAALGTNMLQVGSSDSLNISSDINVLASDLRELADMLSEHGFRLAYENWCWATHASTWKEVWQIVQKVDRENVGLCLDTFQTAAGEWGDPTTKSGMLEDKSVEVVRDRFGHSLQELSSQVPPDKIYLLQISDAYKSPTPLEKDSDKNGLRPRGRWSHDFRPYPYSGGFLPVVDVAKAVLRTGFRGWFSMEVFDGGLDGNWRKRYNLEDFARGAMGSHRRLLSECADGL